MSTPYLGQLSLVGFNFAPIGWQLAQGQILSISQYSALFSLLGTYYGGNGTSNFQLPNLQGSVPVGQGQGAGLSNYTIGETTGSSTVTLLASETPNHTHQPYGKNIVRRGEPGPNQQLLCRVHLRQTSTHHQHCRPRTDESCRHFHFGGQRSRTKSMMPYLERIG